MISSTMGRAKKVAMSVSGQFETFVSFNSTAQSCHKLAKAKV